MRTILVSGGNSGIGLRAARELLDRGHCVVLLGRDRRKGEAALASFGDAAGRASFHSVELSTHDGVRDAARRVLAEHDRLDAVLHSTGVLTFKELRTADGLHPFFSVNYLSRYHLTQLLLPALRRAGQARVVMMTASVPPSTPAEYDRFPAFEPFDFRHDREPIQLANHHYAAHLTRGEPQLRAGVVNAGAVRTDILRMSPWYVRATAKVVGPLFFDSVEKSAHNVVEACLREDWAAPMYWPKPGDFEQRLPIDLDTSTTRRLLDVSRNLTGV
ncbi:SDR family NAD(P)-dependent oxidoreductase [Streptomyces geranii]|uniref:SDR family NAD(P)-dependent oxidoreductase n=1 Tax=Streptomyces geranii TaxID=2058923 RepID=UPI000D04273C|nr:SDR family NAD(P)-dependent oxidoreductase [Streptomyces geranii]